MDSKLLSETANEKMPAHRIGGAGNGYRKTDCCNVLRRCYRGARIDAYPNSAAY
jgi:hypothetical protein